MRGTDWMLIIRVRDSFQSGSCHREGGYSTDIVSIPDHFGVCGVESGNGTGVTPGTSVSYCRFIPSMRHSLLNYYCYQQDKGAKTGDFKTNH
jgi:hypothetical protein